MPNQVKALALLSGGLDSSLAIKLIQNQGIKVIGLYFCCPFWEKENQPSYAQKTAQELGITIQKIDLPEKYIAMVRQPKHGYGSGLNPCIDCKIFMLKEAKKLMKKFKASFIITGEVLDQRPMSQNLAALQIITKESGLTGYLLRPLSAKLLEKTWPEKNELVNREQLVAIKGRGRGRQLELAGQFRIKNYSSPAGGCRLTEKEYAKKLKDLFLHQKKITWLDIKLINIGRHFRLGKNKIIVGKNQAENQKIYQLKGKNDYLLEVPNIGSPTTLLQGPKNKTALTLAAQLTARYSDCRDQKILIKYGQDKLDQSLIVNPFQPEKADQLNLTRTNL